jgi:tRNA-2-methylthio-N6-dimethylallyladenosine synthase
VNKKLHIITYGCQMNEDDSQKVANLFLERGFNLTDNIEKSDAIVINTCTVRQHAEDKALSLLGKLRGIKRNKPQLKIFFIGCAAQRLGNKVKSKFNFVDEVIGSKDFYKMENILNLYYERYSSKDIEYPKLFNSEISDYQTIMRGCSLSCSYCIVPKVRGPAISLDSNDIMREIMAKDEKIKEIILLGQTVNAYIDKKNKVDFVKLIEKISSIEAIKRIKFMSPHPLFFTDDFFKLYRENKKISRQIHLPIQSGSDNILKKMRRGYTSSDYIDIVKRLKEADKNTSISTDFIVGFPGESQKDFEESLEILEKIKFSFAFCFKYSPRTDNPKDISDLSDDEISRRLSILLKKVKQISKDNMAKRIGEIEEVLMLDSRHGKTSTGYNCAIIDSNKKVKQGSLLKAKILKVEKNILHGKVQNEKL